MSRSQTRSSCGATCRTTPGVPADLALRCDRSDAAVRRGAVSAEGARQGRPVFVSYRQSDGLPIATELAWLLRASGVPVWHDQTDLPPGDTSRRLEQALEAGVSGAVLLVTPEISLSGVVRYAELPGLLDLEKDTEFVMVVANTVQKPEGGLDYGAPDNLLGQPSGTLARLKQYPVSDRAHLVDLVREVLAFRAGRVAALTAADPGRPLHVSVQTRGTPNAERPADRRAGPARAAPTGHPGATPGRRGAGGPEVRAAAHARSRHPQRREDSPGHGRCAPERRVRPRCRPPGDAHRRRERRGDRRGRVVVRHCQRQGRGRQGARCPGVPRPRPGSTHGEAARGAGLHRPAP